MSELEIQRSVQGWNDFSKRLETQARDREILLKVNPEIPLNDQERDALDREMQREEIEVQSKRGRGRKTKELTFPTGKFTIKQAAKLNRVSGTCVYLRLIEMQKTGQARVVETKRRTGQRGRGTPIWKVAL